MTKSSDKAADRFYHVLFGSVHHDKARKLIRAAFSLYQEAWSDDRWHRFNIAHWEWPFIVLEAGEPFAGDEPWIVLLRRAVEMRAEGTERHDLAV